MDLYSYTIDREFRDNSHTIRFKTEIEHLLSEIFDLEAVDQYSEIRNRLLLLLKHVLDLDKLICIGRGYSMTVNQIVQWIDDELVQIKSQYHAQNHD